MICNAVPRNRNAGTLLPGTAVFSLRNIHTAKEVLTREQLMQMIVELCVTPHSRDELMQQCGLVNKSNFVKSYIKPLIEEKKIKMTIPDKPSSKNQKYIKA